MASYLAFGLPLIASIQKNHSSNPSAHKCRPSSPLPSRSPPKIDQLPAVPARLLHVRLRLHLLQLSHQQRRQQSPHLTPQTRYPDDHRLQQKPTDFDHDQSEFKNENSNNNQQLKESYSVEERKIRSERLRALWRDPQWREAMLARQRSKEAVAQKSESLKKMWRDESFREKMQIARTGREAPNKGVPASAVTRLRMSAARKGNQLSEETKRRMSLAKKNRPKGDDWPKMISESRKGKTREYFAMRREFRALHKDLKLWSDSFRARHGRLPDSNTFERFVAPMMVLRIRRYLTLRETIGRDEVDVKNDIFQNSSTTK